MDVAGVYAGIRLFVFCRVLKVYVDLCAVLCFFFLFLVFQSVFSFQIIMWSERKQTHMSQSQSIKL